MVSTLALMLSLGMVIVRGCCETSVLAAVLATAGVVVVVVVLVPAAGVVRAGAVGVVVSVVAGAVVVSAGVVAGACSCTAGVSWVLVGVSVTCSAAGVPVNTLVKAKAPPPNTTRAMAIIKIGFFKAPKLRFGRLTTAAGIIAALEEKD